MTAKNASRTDEEIRTPFQRQLNQRQRILVVEDDEDVRRLNAEVLSGSGYKVDAAEDGAIAWDTLKLNSYDLLVTDNNLPRVSGVELLKKLRTARMTLPVILVSGTMPTNELNRHPWLQIDATLLKPYTPDELLAAVRKVLYATDGISGQAAPRPNWEDRPPADHLLL
jgi:DNA-binding response OmpR family regulator